VRSVTVLRSRDNPRVRRWAKLVRDSGLRRKEGRAIVEGPHLLAALLEQGMKPVSVFATANGLARNEIKTLVVEAGATPVVVSESVFRAIADAESPPGIAAEIEIPEIKATSVARCVFLEGVQDPSNVGAILRTAAAFGVGEVVLDRGCADVWSPKVLRAGMGGHFRLNLRIAGDLDAEIERFKGTAVCAVPRGGVPLRQADLGGRLGWIFGAEGQGVSPALQERAALRITIPTAPGTESINVAAAAAICLYEAFSRPAAGS
jgi:RNA methyltransferase, TrmH family